MLEHYEDLSFRSVHARMAKLLRFIGIVLMALTGGFTLLGGIGTTCAALFPTKWESMAPLARFQWLYILFMLAGVAIGVWGVRAAIRLVRGTSDSYTMSLKALITGVVVGSFHIFVSRLLRGKSMPVDAVVYMTVLTLIIFLLLHIPFIWQGANYVGNKNAAQFTNYDINSWRCALCGAAFTEKPSCRNYKKSFH